MSYLGPKTIMQKKREYLIPCSNHFYQEPPQLVKGEMQFLYDSEGKKYLDFFAGVSVVNCGHCNGEIIEKAMEQIKTLQHTSSIYLTEPVVRLAERLALVTPGNLKKSFFCASGSEANEGAMLIAKLHSKKQEFLALDLGLHGRTQETMSITGIGMWRAMPTPSPGIHFVPNPYCYRCPMDLEQGSCGFACVKAVEAVITRRTSGNVAAMVVEAIQGNGGIIAPPKGYFKELKKILDKHEVLLIVDEVQAGFGRTGEWFAINHYDVVPDIMTMAKALGNGVPIAAYITNDKIAHSFTRPSASTLGGNPVSTATGLAVIDYMEENDLVNRSKALGKKLFQGLLKLKEKHGIIGDVRGLGLMFGIELVKDRKTKEPASNEVDVVLEKLKDRGIILGKNGEFRNVLAFMPPLIIDAKDIDMVLGNLDEVILDTFDTKW